MIQRYGVDEVEQAVTPQDDGKYVLLLDHKSDKAAALAESQEKIRSLEAQLQNLQDEKQCILKNDYTALAEKDAEIKDWRNICERLANAIREISDAQSPICGESDVPCKVKQFCEFQLTAYNAMKEARK